MYEIVGGLRASLLSAVKIFATGSGVAYSHINPQYFIHDVVWRLFGYISQVIISNVISISWNEKSTLPLNCVQNNPPYENLFSLINLFLIRNNDFFITSSVWLADI